MFSSKKLTVILCILCKLVHTVCQRKILEGNLYSFIRMFSLLVLLAAPLSLLLLRGSPQKKCLYLSTYTVDIYG
jgi:hypothetical protein